jgi:tetratricopeptide (TPR) repeat protein
MDIDDISSITEQSDEERRMQRRHLGQQAIALAVQSRWQEAADINRQIVELVPDDAEAFNRLGKAYTELGHITEARSAYERALQADPANLIAQRNLDRLSRINESEAAELAKKAGQKLDPRFFMEETGKTGITVLQHPARIEILATLTAGDQVKLEQQNSHLVVTTMDGTYLGRVEDKLATRLTRLMQTGNQYQSGVVGVDGHAVRMIIRETYQSPQNVGRISFPPQASQEALPRPYLREGILRRAGDEEDEDELEIGLGDVDVEDEEDEDSSDFGFHEASLDEA